MSNVSAITQAEQANVNTSKSVKNTITGNTNFSSYLEETKSLNDIFEDAAKKYNVSANLLKAIGKAESDFRVDAVSRCGAQGVMQLMPATAKSLGVTDSFDPEQNIMGGAKYISELLKKYDGNTKLALAAYNAGINNVAKYGGVPPFEETQNYVVKVANYMKEGVDAGSATATTKKASTSPIKHTTNPGIKASYYNPIAHSAKKISGNVAQSLDWAFTYDDYMKFIELLFEKNNELE